MRVFRKGVLGAASLALVLLVGACGSGEDGTDSGDGASIASQFTLGGPPECPQRPFCIPGLEETYGIEFGEFQPLDVGGPQTVQALSGGQIDVGLLFSTSSAIPANDFVVLEDDKGLQTAENITPVVGGDVSVEDVAPLLDEVSGALTTEGITELNGRVELDKEDPADVAADFLSQEGIDGSDGSCSGELTVGAIAFAENQIVAEMYAQVLEQAGCSVDRKIDLGSREILYPALESGEIDVAPEYLGSLLLFLDPDAQATGDPQNNADLLQPLLEEDGLTLLQYSEANDTNAFVVTQETADEYDLSTVSDLAEPAD